ncbi:hypothetical protein P154DRAFT_524134 [Amniculicola lignicola CBS 123094]|uniref:Opioid growth factor receptor (OGFr) conserved domain-containing protein n=1 Tax=Amniculicola lignicola CBS 123094 TaxID=1392246 RepID=A0A6A5W9S7_9PLEO|nr:hypothetical protein P154DRAFT_524134 [Amniculicola lignicola CBS 123094]
MVPPAKRFKFFRPQAEDEDEATSTEDTVPLIIRFYDPGEKARDHSDRTLDDILDWEDRRLEHCHNYIQILFPLPEGSPFNFEAPIITRRVMDAFRSRPALRMRLVESFVRMLEFFGFEFVDEEEIARLEAKKEKTYAGENDPVEEKIETNVTVGSMEVVKEAETAQATESMDENTEAGASPQTQPQPTDVEPTEGETPVDPTVAPSSAGEVTTTSSLLDDFEYPPAAIIVPAKGKIPALALSHNYRRKFGNWAVYFDHNHLRITRILRCLRVLGLQEEAEAFYSALKWTYEYPEVRINEKSMIFWTRAMKRPLSVSPDGDEIRWLQKWELEMEKAAEKEAGKEVEKV